MDEGEKSILGALSAHDKQQLKRQQREEHQQQKETAEEKAQHHKNYLWIAITLVILVAFAATIYYLSTQKEATYTDRQVHWHVLIDMNICGIPTDLPCNVHTPGIVHGEDFCGEPNFHHHHDNTIHIEGLIQKKEDIALGRFFDIIGVPFSNTTLMNYTNGALCGNTTGTLKMYVNDQPRTDFRDYIPFATPDGRQQIVKLVFD